MSDSGPPDASLRFALIDARYRTFRTGIRTLGVFGVAYCLYLAIGEIAGRNTTVSVGINMILNALVDLKFAFTVTLAGACAVWAIAERMLRHRAMARLGARNADLEKRLDPDRTTSGLTPAGGTNPRDRRR